MSRLFLSFAIVSLRFLAEGTDWEDLSGYTYERPTKCNRCFSTCIDMGNVQDKLNIIEDVWTRDIAGYMCGNEAEDSKCQTYMNRPLEACLAVGPQFEEFKKRHGGCEGLCEKMMGCAREDLGPLPTASRSYLDRDEMSVTMREVYKPTCAECKFGYRLIHFLTTDLGENIDEYTEMEVRDRLVPLLKNLADFNCNQNCSEIIADFLQVYQKPLADLSDWMDDVSADDYCDGIKVCRGEIRALPMALAQTDWRSEAEERGRYPMYASSDRAAQSILFLAASMVAVLTMIY